MKRTDITALHEMSVAELNSKLTAIEAELGKSKVENAVGKLKNPASLTLLRKEIARIKTIVREKELGL